ncbi:lipocalin family protein [Salinibius halmophilus]|uniref:lipocalin family protein n=1 Tax=Salinibius halmophilus TaxID=1853216 RepID=UPI0018F2B93E|nr:lipocalin family protein [Salinibius halmophilus]
MRRLMSFIAVVSAFWLSGCVSIPEGITPVSNFDKERYLGTWYEIARYDNRFERNLEAVTATYLEREDGGVRVLNRGWNTKKERWDDIEGKAYFVGDSDVGALKVSFFGPFYSAYNVFELDDGYEYALVTASDRDYFWLLTREPQPSEARVERLVAIAEANGFDREQMLFIDQSRNID